MASARPDLFLIVSASLYFDFLEGSRTNCDFGQSNDDTVYEQDLLRDPGSIKPWLSYIEFKQQNGTAYEQAFVSSPCLKNTGSY